MLAHQSFSVFPILWFRSPVVVVVYPLIPWIGVMALGYAFGVLYQKEAEWRRRVLLVTGCSVTALFVILRALDVYGDPAKRSHQQSALFTALSFVNTTKYPPSLLFLLMTLGPAMIALALFETNTSWPAQSSRSLLDKLRNALVTFGRVPLFFYLLQWYAAHSIAMVVGLIAGQTIAHQYASPIAKFISPPPPGVGFRLWVVYVCWLVGVVLLYPLCKWFAGVKARRRDWWLSYL
jgi:uncharacterized membrane protein